MLDKKIMRRIKVGFLIGTLLLCVIYIVNKWMLYNQLDSSYPEITFEQDILEVSVTATEEELLAGVQAIDKKDGDVTDSIIIESMSNLLEGNQRIVTYAAFDGDNHVGKAERRIQYTDYTPVRFSLSKPIVASSGLEWSELLSPLQVIDCVDGDISDRIVILKSSVVSMTSEYIISNYSVQVTNSCGEVAELKLPVKTSLSGTSSNNTYLEITLSEYLTYTSLGSTLDLSSFITGVSYRGEAVAASDVTISTDLDTSKAGVYTATYSLTRDEATATCDLIIVVEE